MSNNPANARKADARRLQGEARPVKLKYTAALRAVEKSRRRGPDPMVGTPCTQGSIVDGVVRACEELRGKELSHGSHRQDVRALAQAVGVGRQQVTVAGVSVGRASVTFDPMSVSERRGTTTGRVQVDVWVTVAGLVPGSGAVTRVPTRWWLDVVVRSGSQAVQGVEVLQVRRGTGSAGRARAA